MASTVSRFKRARVRVRTNKHGGAEVTVIMPTGMVQIWVYEETRAEIKRRAGAADVTIADLVRAAFETPEEADYKREKEVDTALEKGDFGILERRKPKKELTFKTDPSQKDYEAYVAADKVNEFIEWWEKQTGKPWPGIEMWLSTRHLG